MNIHERIARFADEILSLEDERKLNPDDRVVMLLLFNRHVDKIYEPVPENAMAQAVFLETGLKSILRQL